jgi:hypothetical protein
MIGERQEGQEKAMIQTFGNPMLPPSVDQKREESVRR